MGKSYFFHGNKLESCGKTRDLQFEAEVLQRIGRYVMLQRFCGWQEIYFLGRKRLIPLVIEAKSCCFAKQRFWVCDQDDNWWSYSRQGHRCWLGKADSGWFVSIQTHGIGIAYLDANSHLKFINCLRIVQFTDQSRGLRIENRNYVILRCCESSFPKQFDTPKETMLDLEMCGGGKVILLANQPGQIYEILVRQNPKTERIQPRLKNSWWQKFRTSAAAFLS